MLGVTKREGGGGNAWRLQGKVHCSGLILTEATGRRLFGVPSNIASQVAVNRKQGMPNLKSLRTGTIIRVTASELEWKSAHQEKF